MATFASHSNLWNTAARAMRRKARREALVICSDENKKREYAVAFERRGMKVRGANDCRTGITMGAGRDTAVAVVVPEEHDHYTGPLLNALWSMDPQPDIWLVGNPYALRLSEVIAGRDVAVLPPSTDAELFERVLQALDEVDTESGASASRTDGAWLTRDRWSSVRLTDQPGLHLEVPGLRQLFPRTEPEL